MLWKRRLMGIIFASVPEQQHVLEESFCIHLVP